MVCFQSAGSIYRQVKESGFVCCVTNPALAREEEIIPVYIDKLQVSFDVSPLKQNGRTLVPFRAIAEALNVEVNWDSNTRTVNAVSGGTRVKLIIDEKTAHVDQDLIPLDVAPQIIDGRTLIPLRVFSSAFGCTVEWDESRREVSITSPPTNMTVIGFYALGDSRTSSWTNGSS